MFKKHSEDNVAELIKRRHQCNTQDILLPQTTKLKKKKCFQKCIKSTEVGLQLSGNFSAKN